MQTLPAERCRALLFGFLLCLSCATADQVVSLSDVQRSFEVRIVSQRPAIEDRRCDSFTVAHASGNRFTCCIPQPTAVPQELPRQAAEGRLAIASTAVLTSESCLLKRLGFWTYEICPGKYVRQLHLVSGDGATAGAGSHAVETSAILLGAYAPGRDELLADERGSLVLRQHYAAGADGRAAFVDFSCSGQARPPGGIAFDIAAVDEDVAALQYVLQVASADPAVCGALVAVDRMLAPLNGTCGRLLEGWWTFEVCFGQHVRQWHDAGSGRVQQESVLGEYDWRAGEQLDTASLGEPAAVVQLYGGGTPCDLLGGRPRQALLRFECAPAGHLVSDGGGGSGGGSLGGHGGGSALWSLRSLTEPSTCSYKLAISTPLVCGHPEMSPAQIGPAAVEAVAVECWPHREDEAAP